MGFRFLHTADWQLGKPFAGFEPDLSALLREARMAMIDRIAQVARDEGTVHILVAGDVWDQAMPSDRALLQPVDRMAAAPDLQWWLLPGNHDPAGPEGLWQRLTSRGLPANIHAILDPEPVLMTDDVYLLPAPWTSKRPGRDLTSHFDAIATPQRAKRIGLAHGGVQGFGSDPDASFPIAADRADRAGLSYLALGDWHGTKRAGPRAWYPGTPEPDRFRNNDAGAVLLVDEGQEDEPRRIATQTFSWEMAQARLERTSEIQDEMDPIVTSDWPPHQRLLQIELEGRVTLDQRRDLDRLRGDLAARLAHLEWRDGSLEIAMDDAQSLSSHADLVIAETARRLGESEDHDAQAALVLLDDLLRAS